MRLSQVSRSGEERMKSLKNVLEISGKDKSEIF